jgi:anaerobic ribonucleoside-triphosphate reductase activating protein
MNYQSITYPDFNNGLGCRVTLWVSGCPHHCPGCHNPETWDYNSGQDFSESVKNKLIDVLKLPYIKGLTVSGGEPLCDNNISKVSKLVEEIKILFPEKDIWLYTGYDINELINTKDYNKFLYLQIILENVNFIVDGKYIEKLRDVSLKFRGSSNQNIYQVFNNKCGTHKLKKYS